MKRCCAILPTVFVLLLCGRTVSAEERPAGPAAVTGGGPPRIAAAPGPASGQAVHEVDLEKVWKVSPAYFRKVFDGAGEGEPSGLNAKIDENLSGVIHTKWGPADMLFGSMARFFASSPVLLDREFAVRRAMLYD